MKPGFRFNLGNALIATALMAAWFGDLAYAKEIKETAGPSLMSIARAMAFAVLPFAAIGALFGRWKLGLAVGLGAFLAFFVLVYFLVNPERIHGNP